MNKKITLTCLSIALLLINSMGVYAVNNQVIANAESTTLYVDDDFNETTPGWNVTNFSKIKDAIKKANENDTIYVYNGEYNKSFVIDKPLNLTGENNEQTIIRSDENEDAIRVSSDYVEISNFKIISKGVTGQSINLFKKGKSKISSNILEGDFSGINLYYSSDNEIEANYFNRCGMPIHHSDNNKVSNNIFNCAGLAIVNGDNNEISYNSITSGIIMLDEICNDNIISYNIVQDCETGINVAGYGQNTISYNDFKSNKYFNAWIFSRDCKWDHNYWGGTELIPMPWVISLPKPIFGLFPPRIYIDFDWHPAKTPNCDFGGEV